MLNISEGRAKPWMKVVALAIYLAFGGECPIIIETIANGALIISLDIMNNS